MILAFVILYLINLMAIYYLASNIGSLYTILKNIPLTIVINKTKDKEE